jgi:hypothetical protein
MGHPNRFSSVFFIPVDVLSSTARGFTHAEADSGWLKKKHRLMRWG